MVQFRLEVFVTRGSGTRRNSTCKLPHGTHTLERESLQNNSSRYASRETIHIAKERPARAPDVVTTALSVFKILSP